MFRKSVFAIAAAATIAAALIPTTASAHGFRYRYLGWGGPAFVAAPLVVGSSCAQWVQTPSGFWKKVWVCY
jgi:hypothetical protein